MLLSQYIIFLSILHSYFLFYFKTQRNSGEFSPERLKQGYKDSNLEMTESESVALPFGDSPVFLIVTGVCHLQE